MAFFWGIAAVIVSAGFVYMLVRVLFAGAFDQNKLLALLVFMGVVAVAWGVVLAAWFGCLHMQGELQRLSRK
jgi:hypothetical protein